MSSPEDFYNAAYTEERYASVQSEVGHYAEPEIRRFLEEYRLQGGRCLEIGSGRGAFQDLVADYTGLDLSETVAANYHKPFFTGSAESLPFKNSEFDVIWSITVLEHVPCPDKALAEMRRVLKPGGFLFLKPAWNCRPWNCEGIPVRPYSDLSVRQKFVKATLPVRNSLLVRAMAALPRRLFGLLVGRKAVGPLRYRKLDADYQTFWMADSDACSSIDPFDAIHWFRSRGDQVLSHPTWKSALLSRSEALIVRVVKN